MMDYYEKLFYVEKVDGEWDFGVRGTIYDLPYSEMKEFRNMVMVAIGTAEAMWRRAQESKANQAKAAYDNREFNTTVRDTE